MAATGNWGRWGEDDERGALNLASPDVVRDALGSVSSGNVVCLGLPLKGRGTPTFPPRPPVLHMMSVDGADYEAGAKRGIGGFQFADDHISMAGHAGTHVDALSHVARDGRMYNGHSATEVRSAAGAKRLGIEKFGSFVGRALVIDLPTTLGVPCLEPEMEIGVEHLEAALADGERQVRPGDAILLRTGWLERFREDDQSWYETEPGLGIEAARWLAERDVALIGADNYAIEVVPSPTGEMMPVHLICLQEHGIHLMELVVMAELAAAGVRECLLIVSPLRIVGGVGCPVNPVAVY